MRILGEEQVRKILPFSKGEKNLFSFLFSEKNIIYYFQLVSQKLHLLVEFRTSKKRKFKRDLKKKILQDGNNDYKGTVTNIIASITKSKSLYKKLIIQVHPDRFLDDKKIIAEELTSRITKSKKDYSQLCQLEIEVNDFLKV